VPPLCRRERASLCELFEQVGPDAPTLCAGWTTYDLAAHLVLREAFPVALVGNVVPSLETVADRGIGWLKAREEYAELVERVRNGPPWYSPMRPPKLDRTFNTLEFFIHHEDVRRAGPDHKQPRDLSDRDQHTLWSATRSSGRLLGRRAKVGIELVRTDVVDSVRMSKGEPTVVVRGLPSELALFAYGRGAVAEAEVGGDREALARLEDGALGI
jgi:uncharacterized protein (TIGR03085 family)